MGLGVTDGIVISPKPGGAGGGGTVTSVSGTGTALVGVTVNTPTTTPQIILTVPTAPGKSVWGNVSASVAGPAYTTDPQVLTLTANSVNASTVTAAALLGNATTATTANNLPGGLLGAIPYQSAAGTTTLLNGSTSSLTAVLTQTGNGTTSAAPGWNAITGTPGFAVFSQSPTLTGTTNAGAISCTGTVTTPRYNPSGLAPTIAIGPGAGTTGTPSVSVLAGSCNASGQVTIVTGAVGGTGIVATITFNGTVSPAPRTSQISPANGGAATASTLCYSTIPTTTTWTITTDTVLALGATLIFFYQVI